MNSLFHKKSIQKLLLILKNKKSKDFLIKSSFKNLNKYEKKIESLVKFDKKIVYNYKKNLINILDKRLLYIPFGIKDIFNVKQFTNEKGSVIYKNFNPGNNARVVDRLLASGAIPFGKTVTSEFAVHELNKTKNPYDFTKTPGTSSSGSAASVACGYYPFSLGTQTAGSIIRPASYCNIWGFKPSFGLIPRTGVLKTTDSLDSIGFFCSNGENIKYLLDIMRVSGRNYPFIYKNIDSKINMLNKSKKIYKIAFVKTHTWNYAENYVKLAIENFLNKIDNNSKFLVKEIKLPNIYDEIHYNHEAIYTKSLSYYFKNEFKNREKLLSKNISNMIEKGNKINKDQFIRSHHFQNKIISTSNKIFNNYDAVISISTSESAPLREKIPLDDPSLMWTFLHMPSMNAPIFRCPKNMPFGIQFTAKKFNDYQLLRVLKELFNEKIIYANPYDNI
ncbi:amidase [Pelagibacteraceae bacterium]|nr:amidase [Pelagibacteraceae bacterium]